MKGRIYSSQAIVLARKNYSEADRILVVLSKNYGKLSLLAKGVRRPQSRKRGCLEVFSLVKFQANKGKALDLVTEVEMINSFSALRKNLKRVSLAYFFCEVIGRVTKDNQKNDELFKLLLKSLNSLKKVTNLQALRKNFVRKTLVISGFWPENRRLDNPDQVLEEVVERKINSVRVGKRVLS
jgi:DNA repair protein RecO (recombination protein O)